MRKTLTTLVATATAAMMVLAGTTTATAKDRPTGEQRLAKMLEGREAGKPVSCIGDRKSTRLNSSHIQKSRMPSSA